jgi:hypothetical protein
MMLVAAHGARARFEPGLVEEVVVAIMARGGAMSHIGSRIMVGLVCGAALMTPVSGMPHFCCRCPNGRVKSFCLGLSFKSTGCCCGGGSCCSGSPTAKSCCCRKHAACRAPKEDSRNPSVLPGTTFVRRSHCSPAEAVCVKTLTAAALLAPSADKRTAVSPLQSADLPTLPARAYFLDVRAPDQRLRLAHSPAPPADRVTLLRRLVI